MGYGSGMQYIDVLRYLVCSRTCPVSSRCSQLPTYNTTGRSLRHRATPEAITNRTRRKMHSTKPNLHFRLRPALSVYITITSMDLARQLPRPTLLRNAVLSRIRIRVDGFLRRWPRTLSRAPRSRNRALRRSRRRRNRSCSISKDRKSRFSPGRRFLCIPLDWIGRSCLSTRLVHRRKLSEP